MDYLVEYAEQIDLIDAFDEEDDQRRPPVFNRRLDPMEALSDVEFKSHFR